MLVIKNFENSKVLINRSLSIKKGVYYWANEGIRYCNDIKEGQYRYGSINHVGQQTYDFHTWKNNVIAVERPIIQKHSYKIKELIVEQKVYSYPSLNMELSLIEDGLHGDSSKIISNLRRRLDSDYPKDKIFTIEEIADFLKKEDFGLDFYSKIIKIEIIEETDDYIKIEC
jgi:hypothetical protein